MYDKAKRMACFNPGLPGNPYYPCFGPATYCPPLIPDSCCGPTGPTGATGTPTSFFQAQLSQTNGSVLVNITGVLTAIVFNAVRTGNADGAFNPLTGAYTAPQTGYYNFSVGVVVIQTAAVLAIMNVALQVNGISTDIKAATVPATVSQPVSISFSSLLKLNAGDTVQVAGTASSALAYASSIAPAASYTSFQVVSLF